MEMDNVDEEIDGMKKALGEYLLNTGISKGDKNLILEAYYDYWVGEISYVTFLEVIGEYYPEKADVIVNKEFVYEGDWVE